MKNKLLILVMFLFGVFTVGYANAKTNSLDLLGKVIYLDPGHGGIDPGAVYKDIEEADINLKIAQKTQKILEKEGAIVYLTRYGDYDLSVPNTINKKRSDLSRRGNIINRSNCDLYLSIHLNAETSNTWKGAQMFYDNINKENEKIAKIFQEVFKKNLKTNRKYKQKESLMKHFKEDLGTKRKLKTTDLYLYRNTRKVGVLIECGFLSNPNERYLLTTEAYQQKVANTILEAAIEYFN